LIYGLGGTISKIIPFIMLPIVVRLIPDPVYFGISNMVSIVVSFGSSLAILGTYDAMFRLFFEKEDDVYRKKLCSSSLFVVLLSSTLISLIIIMFAKFFARLFFNSSSYTKLVYITSASVFIGSVNVIITAPTRMMNKRRIFLLSNTIFPIVSYTITILLLVSGFYLYALPISGLLTSITSFLFFFSLNYSWFRMNLLEKSLIKELLKIGLPLTPTFLIYWIFSSSDRVMLSKMLGDAQMGIYSVGAKLATVSQLVYSGFAGGWQYFAFSTMKDDDYVKLITKTFELLGALSLISFLLSLPFSKIVFKILFPPIYQDAFLVFPYLFLGPLLLMLYQIASNQLLVIKNSFGITLTLLFGAILNIFFNFLLIPILGNEGAAIATVIGYAFSLAVVILKVYRLKLLTPSYRFYLSFILTIIGYLLWRIWFVTDFLISLSISALTILLIFRLYRKDILPYFKRFGKLIGT